MRVCLGKLDKTDWQMQVLEKKIEESQNPGSFKDSKDTKVPKWNKDAFTDKVTVLNWVQNSYIIFVETDLKSKLVVADQKLIVA